MTRRNALLIMVALGLWFLPGRGPANPVQDPTGSAPPARLGGSPLMVIANPGPSVPVDTGSFSMAQARAYAALGEVADGGLEQMPAFDAETRAVVEAMRRLLAAQPLQRGGGQTTMISTGATAAIAPRANELSTKLGEAVGPASHSGPMEVADGLHRLNITRTTGVMTLGPEGHVISGSGLWAAIKAKPGQGLPVRITDHGEGGHVIALFGEDFGTVRVNGGLVIPGRYYLIKGGIEITGMTPLGIHIRPLSAVPSYHEQPLMAPSANG